MSHRAQADQDRRGRTFLIGAAAIALFGSVAGGALMFLNEILVARFLGVELYGVFALAFVLAKVGEAVSAFGLPLSILRFVAIYNAENEGALLVGAVFASLLLPLFIAGGLAAALSAGASWIAQTLFQKDGLEEFLKIVALAVPFMCLSDVLGAVTRGMGHAWHYVIVRSFTQAVVFLAFLGGIYAIDAAPVWIAIAFVVSHLCAFMVGVACLGITVGPQLWRTRPVFPFGTLYRFTAPVFANVMLYLALLWTDILLLGVLTESGQVGVYRACVHFTILFNMIVIAINSAAAHQYSIHHARDRKGELAAAYTLALRLVNVLAIPLFLVIVFNGRALLGMIGPDFAAGASALAVLALGNFVGASVGSAAFVLIVSGRQSVEMLNAAIAAALNLGLNLLLIPKYGILGAATATSASLLLISALRVCQVRALLSLTTFSEEVVRLGTIGVGAAAAAAATAALGYWAGSQLSITVLSVFVIVATFAVGAWNWGLSPEERAQIQLRLLAATKQT